MTSTTATTSPSTGLYVDDFTLTGAGSFGRPLHLSTDDEEVYSRPRIEGAGTVVVRVGVDLDHDTVAMEQDQSSRLALLDVAIRDLQRVRDTLAGLTPTAADGRCMNGHDWGRCLLAHDHQGACEGPTEAEWRATLAGVSDRAPS